MGSCIWSCSSTEAPLECPNGKNDAAWIMPQTQFILDTSSLKSGHSTILDLHLLDLQFQGLTIARNGSWKSLIVMLSIGFMGSLKTWSWSPGMLNKCPFLLSHCHQSHPPKMRIYSWHSLCSKVTKLFGRQFIHLWILAWMTLYCAPEMLQLLPTPSTSSSPMRGPHFSHHLNCPFFLQQN